MSEATELANARLSTITELRTDVSELTKAVNKLARVVDEAYPTWDEVNEIVQRSQGVNSARRRATVYAATLVLIAATFLANFHVHRCMTFPLEGTLETFVCDAIAPTYAHAVGISWPTLANVIGWGVYGSLITISLLGFMKAIPKHDDEQRKERE